jgi:hypothetical protein
MRCGRAVVLLGLLLLLDARVRAAGLGLGDRDTSEVEQLERDAVQDESGAVREVKQAQRDSSVMRQLEREARKDDQGAARDAAKAAALEKALGETGTETKFKRLEREMDADGSAEAAADVLGLALKQGSKPQDGAADGGKHAPTEQHVSGADVIPGETGIQSTFQDGEAVLAMMGDGVTTKGRSVPRAGRGDGRTKDSEEERDLIAEAEAEGECIGECQGTNSEKCSLY